MIVYPYNCPFWEESSVGDLTCIHRCSARYYEASITDRYGDKPLTDLNCELGRRFCYICVDLDNPTAPKTAEELLKIIRLNDTTSNITPSEVDTITVNIRDFYSRNLIECGSEKGENKDA